MNIVRTYSNLQGFLQKTNQDYRRPIPILLIRPDVLWAIHEQPIYHMLDLDYFNRRTGQDVTFFLPGYSDYPITDTKNIIDSNPIGSDDVYGIRFYHYAHNEEHYIWFSNKDFTDFIRSLEQHAFQYIGDTELLLLPYNPGNGGLLGDFEVHEEYRYNLTSLFFRGKDEHHGAWLVRRFLEKVYYA